MSNVRISEIIKIRRRVPCGTVNEIFIAWINSRGGIDGYLFDAEYATARNSSTAILITKEVELMATEESIISMIKKDSIKELSLIAPQVDNQTRIGLEELLYSPKVKLLRNGLNAEWDDVDGPEWQEVIVLDGRTDMGDTDEDVFDFPVRIQLQPTQTLSG